MDYVRANRRRLVPFPVPFSETEAGSWSSTSTSGSICKRASSESFAAFDTRTGRVYGMTAERKRQAEFIAFLEQLDREIPASVTVIHVVLDNLRMHKGKQVQAWLAAHPRFVFHHPPVHCSWMNQVEQWFSILQRKRLAIVDFASKAELAEKLQQFMAQWNEQAHPFNWTTKSVAKVMAKCQPVPMATIGTMPQAA